MDLIFGEKARLRVVSETQSNLIFSLPLNYTSSPWHRTRKIIMIRIIVQRKAKPFPGYGIDEYRDRMNDAYHSILCLMERFHFWKEEMNPRV